MDMPTEHSYGALLYFVHEGIRYFVLIGAMRKSGYQSHHNRTLDNDTPIKVEYGFPKGHPEPEDNGSILANVIREIQEETGIQSDQLILEDFDEQKPAFAVSYDIINKHGQTITKTSTYYALEMKHINPLTVLDVPSDFVHEIHDIRIVAEDQVQTILSHDNEKVVFQQRLESFSSL